LLANVLVEKQSAKEITKIFKNFFIPKVSLFFELFIDTH